MLRDLVGCACTAPGTNTTITLGAALTGFRAFSASNAFSNGATCFYLLTDNIQAEWGYATLVTGSPDTLTGRTPILNTAGTTARLNFSGTTICYNMLPSGRALWVDNTGALVGLSQPVSFLATSHIVSGNYYGTGVGVDLDGGGTIRVGTAGATNGYAFEAFYNNTVLCGTVAYNGSGGVSYNQTSDYRLKITYGPADASFIDRIPIHHGAWKQRPDTRYPLLLAHELAEHAPFAVFGKQDALEPDGRIKPQLVDYSCLIPAMIARLQDRGREVDELRAEMGVLSKTVLELARQVAELD